MARCDLLIQFLLRWISATSRPRFSEYIKSWSSNQSPTSSWQCLGCLENKKYQRWLEETSSDTKSFRKVVYQFWIYFFLTTFFFFFLLPLQRLRRKWVFHSLFPIEAVCWAEMLWYSLLGCSTGWLIHSSLVQIGTEHLYFLPESTLQLGLSMGNLSVLCKQF